MSSTRSIARAIIIFTTIMLFMGSMALGVSPDQNVKARFSGTIPTINASYGSSLFTGQVVTIALNPQPEPPIYRIGSSVGKGLFSGLIVHPGINPQPEPSG
jgi:hypothetical protein